MNKPIAAFAAAILLSGTTLGSGPEPSREHAKLGALRLDQVQYIETHNSYHIAPDSTMLLYLMSSGYSDGPEWPGQALARAIAYSNLPLETQLQLGLRAFELDLYDDPQGGRFAEPGIFAALRRHGLAPDAPWDAKGTMGQPGFKVFHKEAYDPRSTCPLFRECLREIANWSDRHRDHVPILIMLEIKGGTPGRQCPILCKDGWTRLEAEISSTFGPDRLIRSSDVAAGWPTIDRSRGKVMFFLLDEDRVAASYRVAAASSNLSLLLAGERPGEGAPLPVERERWAILPDPADPRIATAQGAGMLTYTRADTDTAEARADDVSRRDRALASGATIVSTDYPLPDRRFSDYMVRFADGSYLRCNPVTAKGHCPAP
ncbi:hypothetical protein SZ64_11570 [Erythrobacter sp. SG61-1L]|nr:hypothetical protein SZ64_11570 [Erythrobacter sp. SG61-1L]